VKRTDLPANISLMELSSAKLQSLKPVRVLDMFDGTGKNYHEDGLFSSSIFGRVGSDERDTRFSFIDVNTKILHPLVYRHLVKLRGLYKGIMSGKAYAVWDDKVKDFEASDEINGQTGYQFFLSHWKDIVFHGTGSDVRDVRIQFIEKYKGNAESRYVLVLPAGLRDVHIDETGRIKEGEINTFYRTIISISNSIGANAGGDSKLLDNSRHSLQMAFNNVYDFLNNLVEGKGGFIMGKWGARRIYNGTRNVITAMDTSPSKLGADNAPKINSTGVGLYQYLKGVLPKAKFMIANGWLKNVFVSTEGTANLINATTLKREVVKVSSDVIDRWTSTAGIEKIINSFAESTVRSKPIMISGYYIGLVYAPKTKMVFRMFGDIDELPADLDRADVHPMTLVELLYLSGYRVWNNAAMYVTRYPITGVGSIYPSIPYVKTTIVGERRVEVGSDWQPLTDQAVALEYPKLDQSIYVDSMIPHPSRIGGAGGDFDGDMMSANFLYTDEGVAEVHAYLNKIVAYLSPTGGLKASAGVETIERVLIGMTGD
jgi:hypothetical protein